MCGIERLDPRAGRGQDLGVARQGLGRGVPKVTQDRKMDVRIEVAECLNLDVRQQRTHTLDTVEDRWHDDHRPCRLRDAIEIETRQAPRWDQAGDRPLEDLDGEFGGRHHSKQRDHDQQRPAPPVPHAVRHRCRKQQCRSDEDRTQVYRRGVLEEEAPDTLPRIRDPGDALLERATPSADQVITDVRGPRIWRLLGNLPRAFNTLPGEAELSVACRFRELFDRVPISVAASEIHARCTRRPDLAAAPARRG